MSFSGTPLGQGRRLDHNTFLGKPSSSGLRPPSPHRIVPTSYSYGAPTLETRSPPRPTSQEHNKDTQQPEEEEDNDSALARFAKIKQREALASRPGGPKIITSPPKPDRWYVKDTSVLIASALHIAANNSNMLPATNPNNSWSSGVARPNPVVPRSTSVEYEKETQTTNTSARRLAPPPNRLSGPPPVRKPLSKNSSVRLVPDSEGEEGSTTNTRGKSPLAHVFDAAKKALGPATYYVRQLSREPEDHSMSTNGNNSHVRDSSYDYTAEEQDFQAAQQAKRASQAVQKRKRISIDNRAYKPSVSDAESSDEDYSDEDKQRRRRKKKGGAVGGPLTTLPVLSADKKKKRRSRGKSGALGPDDDDEESESDEQSMEVEVQTAQAQQRSSVPRSLPPPFRQSVPRGSAPPADLSIQDSHMSSIEEGLHSIPELPEEDLPTASERPGRERRTEMRRRSRSASRTRVSPRFSIGGLLGRLVHTVVKGILMVVRIIIYLIANLFFLCGRLIGTVYDVTLNRPVMWLRSTNFAPAFKLARYLALGIVLYGIWYGLHQVDISSHLPSLSFPKPSSRPIYTAPEVPASNVAEVAERLQRIEIALSGLSERTNAKAEDGIRSHSELLGRLGSLEDRLTAETKRASDIKTFVKDVNNMRKQIEVLQSQLLAQQRQRQQEQQHRVEQTNDEEARSKLKTLEERVGTVEGGVKEAIELGKKLGTKAVTVKSPGGQDLKTMIQEIVDQAIQLNNMDGIGKADFAMHSSGARVVPHLTSPSFEITSRSLAGQIFGLLTGNGYAMGRPPVTALHHEAHSGYCWPFAGHEGQLGVSLAAPTIIEEISIDHIAKKIAFDWRSAPRQMEVWAMIDGKENMEKYLAIKEERENKRKAERELEGKTHDEETEEPYPATLPKNIPYMRIADFTYDIHASNNVQTFAVLPEVRDAKMDFGIVVLRVLSNWGREEFTCLYRFRVHGKLLGEMPIPEPEEDTGL